MRRSTVTGTERAEDPGEAFLEEWLQGTGRGADDTAGELCVHPTQLICQTPGVIGTAEQLDGENAVVDGDNDDTLTVSMVQRRCSNLDSQSTCSEQKQQ